MLANDGLWVLGGYLCGSIPFALLIGRARGVDIRKIGSGNVGAANVTRSIGRWWGLLCLLLDALKGLVPVVAAITRPRLRGPRTSSSLSFRRA